MQKQKIIKVYKQKRAKYFIDSLKKGKKRENYLLCNICKSYLWNKWEYQEKLQRLHNVDCPFKTITLDYSHSMKKIYYNFK